MNRISQSPITLGNLVPTPPWVRRVEWIALAGFSFGLALSKALANVSLALLAIPFVWHLIHHRPLLSSDPLIRLCAFWIAYVAILGGAEMYLLGLEKMPAFIEVFGVALIPLFAMSLHGRSDRMHISLALALAGVVIKIVLDGNWFGSGPLYDYTNSQKALGVNRNISAPLINTALLGILFLLNEQRRLTRNKKQWVVVGASLSMLGLLLYVWVTLSSRASWISFVLAVLASIYCVNTWRKDTQHSHARPLVLTCVTLGALIGFSFGPAMLERLTAESDTWRALITGDWGNIPFSSVGVRFRLAHIGFDYFLQRPITGWGPTITQLIAENTRYPEVSDSVQLHNGMLELLVRTGLIGLSFYVAASMIVYRGARELITHHANGLALFAWLIGTFVIIAINNFSISLIYFQHGWQLIIFAGGMAYGHRYRLREPFAGAFESRT
jgi:O-antigen ligase